MITGPQGEELAARLLRKNGYRILERNFRTGIGEIDIIAMEKGTLVFIEVKTRTSDAFGTPFEAVTRRKRDKIKKTALLYLKNLRREVPVRFDVVSIMLSGSTEKMEIMRDAFE